jgi:hypothetical protein
LRILVGLAGGISGLSAFVIGYLVYFEKTLNLATGQFVDGFGRDLFLTPTIIRFIFRTDSLWAGAKWAVIDWISIMGLMSIAYFSLSWAFNEEL